MKIGIIGLGFMGGSLARSIKKVNNKIYIVANDLNENYLTQAKIDGSIDDYSTSIDSKFSDLDFVFLCLPIEKMVGCAQELEKVVNDRTIVTDISGAKSKVVKQLDQMNFKYVSGHPMKGSEKPGYINSHDKLLENTKWIFTPTELTDMNNLNTLSELITYLGATPYYMSVEEHDKTVSDVSHIPHVLASVESAYVGRGDIDNRSFDLAAGGFKDSTRIANVNVPVWTDIYLRNKENILEGLKEYRNILDDFIIALKNNDLNTIISIMEDGKAYRASFDAPKQQEDKVKTKIFNNK